MSSIEKGMYEIDVEEVEFLRHGAQSLLARLLKPRGAPPFPALVELHGGAWCDNDRTNDDPINEQLAMRGITVIAIDFRMPPEACYPASMMDINYAIRWSKHHAHDLGIDPESVGVMGTSSGGHQAVLTGMRPGDARYCAAPLPADASAIDASVNCVVALWPVIDPLGRYHYAKEMQSLGKFERFTANVLPKHGDFWQSEEAMAEGNPLMALEREEPVALPPTLYIQSRHDTSHPVAHAERFVSLYRAAGGQLELELTDESPRDALRGEPQSAATPVLLDRIEEFVKKHMRR